MVLQEPCQLLLPAEGTPVFHPKRQKYHNNDENSPYKTYLEKVRPSDDKENYNDENLETIFPLSQPCSSLTPEVKKLCFPRSQSESALAPLCSIKKALERSRFKSLDDI